MLVVVGPLASLGIYILKVWPKPGKRRAEEQEEGEESGETFWRKRCEEEEKRSQGLKAALEESESKLEQEQSERKRAEDERDTEKKDREAVQAFLEEAKQQQESLNQRLKLLGDAKEKTEKERDEIVSQAARWKDSLLLVRNREASNVKEVVDDIDDVVKDMEMEIEVSVIGADQLRESRPLLPVDRRHQDQDRLFLPVCDSWSHQPTFALSEPGRLATLAWAGNQTNDQAAKRTDTTQHEPKSCVTLLAGSTLPRMRTHPEEGPEEWKPARDDPLRESEFSEQTNESFVTEEGEHGDDCEPSEHWQGSRPVLKERNGRGEGVEFAPNVNQSTKERGRKGRRGTNSIGQRIKRAFAGAQSNRESQFGSSPGPDMAIDPATGPHSPVVQ